ncbi:uncharacterized protein BDR25DRAFT_351801 [Lindgomyces ingoldianus]|uniref:Uncharacterized protein n=1 Tax=Lindgomyces ingoldianus TaxID=673940 RepID=A0ACB6R722_9PLEO|nr:uncharacterized protein BDR25DRAFT_351801 [Lindgomyces ingoldianus]KAF2474246.1 hypothetical protein BDR25DRAFT_351801 [Lindgomyces ingoldianus]
MIRNLPLARTEGDQLTPPTPLGIYRSHKRRSTNTPPWTNCPHKGGPPLIPPLVARTKGTPNTLPPLN